METEKELLDYLLMDPVVRQQQRQEYEDYITAQIYDQKQADTAAFAELE